MKNTETSTAERLTYEQTEMIQELVNCALACDSCHTGSVREDQPALHERSIQLTRECADICFQASRLIMRDSELAETFLKVCEEACRLCAEECRKYAAEHHKICAEACESCATDCHEYHNKVSHRGSYLKH